MRKVSQNTGGKQTMEEKCLLSVAMIVKNEENNIERALSSIKPYVDEIIVVDTGSTDRTVELARKYTEKIYFHEWKNDFSEARNNSLKYPTCEWVLIYDADEEVREDFAGIREFLQSLPKDVNTIYLPTISYLDWSMKRTEIASTPRIFRNGTIHYQNIVHNQPIYKGKVIEANFKIYHYGYIWTRKLAKQKYDRTRNMLVKLIEEGKNLSVGEKMYYLVQLYKSETLSPDKTNLFKVANQLTELFNSAISNKKKVEIPAIVLEFFFIHGNLLLNLGYRDRAEIYYRYLENSSVDIDNPDKYYAMLGLSEYDDNYDAIIEYGEKFIKTVKEALENPEKFKWTIVSVKYVASGYVLLAKAYLKKNNFEKFKENYLKALEWQPKTVEDYKKILLNPFVSEFIKYKNKEQMKEVIFKLLTFLKENNYDYERIWEIIYAYKDFLKEIEREVLEYFVKTRFQKLFLEKVYTEKDKLKEYIFGQDPKQFVKSIGVPALITYFEFFGGNENPTESLKFLGLFKDDENEVIAGISNVLIGDVYLKLSNFKMALDYYKQALSVLPEIHTFVKPVLEDLKTRLDSDTEECFEELRKFYKSSAEFQIEFSKLFPIEELEKLYLISDTDLAKYISAVYNFEKDVKLTEKLLLEIKEKEKFDFYEYRLAKVYEQSKENFEKSFELHLESIKKNKKIADLSAGTFEYVGFYGTESSPLPNFEKVIWVGNISERFTGFGAIHPIRVWEEKEEGFYVAYPKPNIEARKLYEKRKKEWKLNDEIEQLPIDKIVNLILELGESKIFLDGGPEELKRILKEFGIEVSDTADTIVSFNLVNWEEDLSKELKKYKKGILFYYVPDFYNRKDPVFSHPLVRVIRTAKCLHKEIEKNGFKTTKSLCFGKEFRALLFV